MEKTSAFTAPAHEKIRMCVITGGSKTIYRCMKCGSQKVRKSKKDARMKKIGHTFFCVGNALLTGPDGPRYSGSIRISPIYFMPGLEPCDEVAARVVAPETDPWRPFGPEREFSIEPEPPTVARPEIDLRDFRPFTNRAAMRRLVQQAPA